MTPGDGDNVHWLDMIFVRAVDGPVVCFVCRWVNMTGDDDAITLSGMTTMHTISNN